MSGTNPHGDRSLFGPPTISRPVFAAQLAGSPVLAERPAGEYYDQCVALGADPNAFLAIFRHESDCARNPAAVVRRYGNKNWGNTRSIRRGHGRVIQTDRGPFVDYESWLTSLDDCIWRIQDPTYAYAKAGATTVRTVIPIFAPATDSNRPDRYGDAVLADMARWSQLSVPERPRKLPRPRNYREHVITSGGKHRPGFLMRPQGLTVHETANTNPGTDAANHREFVQNGGGRFNVSFHFAVDDHEMVQILRLNENGWHAGDGDGDGNMTTLGIETCVNSDGNWAATQENLAQLVAYLMSEFALTLEQVYQHNHWSGKNCPTNLRRGGWEALRIRVLEILQDGGAEVEQENPNRAFLFKAVGLDYSASRFARLLGVLEREGEFTDARHGGWPERVALYSKGAVHTWRGSLVSFHREGEASLTELLKAGRVVLW